MKNIFPFIAVVGFFQLSLFDTSDARILSCVTALDVFPNYDLAYEHSRNDLPRHRSDLKRLNSLLAPEHRFTEAQLQMAAYKLAYPSSPIVQLRQMMGFPGQTDGWFSLLNGKNGSWEMPVYLWLKALVENPFPSRELLQKDRIRDYENLRGLDPIDQHRYQLAKEKLESVEKEIGQALYSSTKARDQRLIWMARDNRNYEEFIHEIDRLRSTPKDLPLSQWNDLITAFADAIHKMGLQDENFSASLLLQAVIDRPEIREEVRLYLSKAKELGENNQRLKWFEEAYSIIRRIRGLYTGEKSFLETVQNIVASKIINSYRFAAMQARGYSGHYIGPALHYSINKSVPRDPLFQKDHEAYDRILEEIKLDDVRVQFLGTMHYQNIPMMFGKPMGKDPSRTTEYIFAAEIQIQGQVRNLAIATRPKFRGAQKYDVSDFAPENLLDIEISEIREVLKAARLTDAVRIFPFDLDDPMVKMIPTSEKGSSPFKNKFNSLQITHVPLNKQREIERSLDEHKMDFLTDVTTALFTGTSYKGEDTIRFKLFNDNRQSNPIEYVLPLTKRSGSQEVFEQTFPNGLLMNVTIRMTRNLITGRYTLEVQSRFNLVGVGAGHWSAEFAP